MEPVSLAILAVVVGISVILGLSIVWWAIKTAVRTAVKLVVLSVAAVVLLGAVASVAAVILLS
jgi:hypothetical protein